MTTLMNETDCVTSIRPFLINILMQNRLALLVKAEGNLTMKLSVTLEIAQHLKEVV